MSDFLIERVSGSGYEISIDGRRVRGVMDFKPEIIRINEIDTVTITLAVSSLTLRDKPAP